MSAFTELVEEELAARGWDRDRLATEMTKSQWGVNRIVVDLLLCEKPLAGMTLGQEIADLLAAAFGTSAELWLNMWAMQKPVPPSEGR